MDAAKMLARYRELQQYVGWTAADAARVQALAPLLQPCLSDLIDDFYDEINNKGTASRNIVNSCGPS